MKLVVMAFTAVIVACTPLSKNGGHRESRIVVYDIPNEALYTHHNDDYTVRVRVPGGDWRDLYEYNVKVDLDNPQNASMVYFDFQGTVEVAVQNNNGMASNVEVRPSNEGISPKLEENTAYFTISEPTKISVEFDGDRLHNLHLFANAIEESRPDPEGESVMWFGPGVHEPSEKGAFAVPSNTTVYISGGALLKGGLHIKDVENVTVKGHGVIDKPHRGFEITNSRNITIDGPIVINPEHYTVYGGQSHNLKISNLKTFSADPWTDGIDLMSCSDVLIDDVFLRTSDDSIAIYAHRWDYYGDVENIQVINSTLWADIAHPIHIGIHGNAKSPEVIESLLFKNIDVLEHDEDDRNYQGVMAISAGDANLVRNVRFENIRISRIEEGMLFNFRSVFNEKYSHAPGRGVENIVLKDILYDGMLFNRSVIKGHSERSEVDGIELENVVVGGQQVEFEDIDIGDHVGSVTLK
ncbi:glycosyl hydrolase family 28 protein [Marinimicrobium koreense]|uniref:glycosyl hydrolase family 28 protein n=1 Tax=Marinimicrobium koreense TaxID=306545 RepID=UPI003F6EDE3D